MCGWHVCCYSQQLSGALTKMSSGSCSVYLVHKVNHDIFLVIAAFQKCIIYIHFHWIIAAKKAVDNIDQKRGSCFVTVCHIAIYFSPVSCAVHRSVLLCRAVPPSPWTVRVRSAGFVDGGDARSVSTKEGLVRNLVVHKLIKMYGNNKQDYVFDFDLVSLKSELVLCVF